METKIRLNNIQLYGWHGVGDNEKITGQQFEIDVEILLNLTSTIASDNIKKILFGESKKSKGYSSIFQIKNKKEIFHAEIIGEKVTTTYRSKLLNIKEMIENYVNQ